MRKSHFLATIFLGLMLVGCGSTPAATTDGKTDANAESAETVESAALTSIKEDAQAITNLVDQASDSSGVYYNKNLDLLAMQKLVEGLAKKVVELEGAEQEAGQNVYASAKMFYLSERFEREYDQDAVSDMKDTRDEVKDFLSGEDLKDWVEKRGSSSDVTELLSEMDTFINAEEKYLDEAVSVEEFKTVLSKVDMENLFEAFYKFIDTEALFGQVSLELVKTDKGTTTDDTETSVEATTETDVATDEEKTSAGSQPAPATKTAE